MKHPIRTAITAVVIGAAACPAMAQEPADTRAVWHQQVADGYAALQAETEALVSQTLSYCGSPADAQRQALERQWRQAFEAWQAVRWVDFGPVEQGNRAWQFQFWPDPKNLIGRKASLLLQTPDADIGKAVAEGGVAVQGFPMAEYLIFDSRLNQGDQALPAPATCRALRAVAAFAADNSAALVNEWQVFEAAYTANELYLDSTVRAGMTALDILAERRLAAPMGFRGNDRRSVYLADAWRSEYSLAAVRASLEGLRQQFLPGLRQRLMQADETALADRIARAFDDALARLDAMPVAMRPLLDDDEAFGQLQGLYVTISQLQQLVNGQAATALGVIRGFNSSDGD
ncbi:hypothetical protein DYI22_05760 [Marinobacter lipolyticus]|uniref:imelysin family protein n=1 Tax=Marinobacter lipolyticus TaxID=209639 RepID=UPI001BCE8420|nr:imelysin family protein [Marinobacter lipolyticus]MBS8240007.1 hypothetical protein [Marinobacter lipolyticus]